MVISRQAQFMDSILEELNKAKVITWLYDSSLELLTILADEKELFRLRGKDVADYVLEWKETIPKEDLKYISQWSEQLFSKKYCKCEFKINFLNEQPKWLQLQGKPFYENNQLKYTGVLSDVSEEKEIVKSLKEKEFYFENILNGIQDGICILDTNFNIIRINKALEDTHQHKLPIEGKKCYEVFHDDAQPCNNCPTKRAIQSKKVHTNVLPLKQIDNTNQWLEVLVLPLLEEGNVWGVIEHIRNISDQKKAEEKIRQMAYFDTLTGLPNRYYLNNYLGDLVNKATVEDQIGVMFIDLNNFKIINNVMGQTIGDLVLVETSKKLQKCCQQADLIARYGGDSFVVIFTKSTKEHILHIAQKIIADFNEPLNIENEEVYAAPGIGISLYPQDGEDRETLIQCATSAKNLSKQSGERINLFSKNLNSQLVRRVKLENGLRKAVERDEFILNYQPQIDLETGEIIGAEALIRWHHPELGIVSPMEFIPIAEETGLIISIGKWVLKTACRQNKIWQEQGLAYIPVSVNVSAKQFQNKDIINTVKEVLVETQLEPRFLELELTENIMYNIKELTNILSELKSLGIKIAIDDFGTGYSSLSILKYLSVNRLKIDKSFIMDLYRNPNSASIAKAIIDMGNNLKFEVLAEGIESKDHSYFLLQNHCKYGQGYYYSKPLSSEEIEKYIIRSKKG